jgi:predicted esterase YcpF (UPF0227 family)
VTHDWEALADRLQDVSLVPEDREPVHKAILALTEAPVLISRQQDIITNYRRLMAKINDAMENVIDDSSALTTIEALCNTVTDFDDVPEEIKAHG